MSRRPHVDHTHHHHDHTTMTTSTSITATRPHAAAQATPQRRGRARGRATRGGEMSGGRTTGARDAFSSPWYVFFLFHFSFFCTNYYKGPEIRLGPLYSFHFSHPAATYHPRTGARDASRAQTKLQASFGLKVSFFSFYLRVFVLIKFLSRSVGCNLRVRRK